MTARNPNRDEYVPASFDVYVDVNCEPVSSGERCTGCLAGRAIARDHVNSYCEPCLRAMHASDFTQEQMVRSLLGGAVHGALDAGASRDLIHAVVQDALADPPEIT